MSSSEVRLRWAGHKLVFEGGVPGRPQITLDSDGAMGPSPMQVLLLSVAGCMGVDIRMILEKGRVPMEGLEIAMDGVRAQEPPRRFLSLSLVARIWGASETDEPKLERALALSRDKYCSVLHTLQPDLELDMRIERA